MSWLILPSNILGILWEEGIYMTGLESINKMSYGQKLLENSSHNIPSWLNLARMVSRCHGSNIPLILVVLTVFCVRSVLRNRFIQQDVAQHCPSSSSWICIFLHQFWVFVKGCYFTDAGLPISTQESRLEQRHGWHGVLYRTAPHEKASSTRHEWFWVRRAMSRVTGNLQDSHDFLHASICRSCAERDGLRLDRLNSILKCWELEETKIVGVYVYTLNQKKQNVRWIHYEYYGIMVKWLLFTCQ